MQICNLHGASSRLVKNKKAKNTGTNQFFLLAFGFFCYLKKFRSKEAGVSLQFCRSTSITVFVYEFVYVSSSLTLNLADIRDPTDSLSCIWLGNHLVCALISLSHNQSLTLSFTKKKKKNH